MLPKKIHYCWVGGKPLSPLALKCIASWKKYCPDYEIIQWDENNYDFFKHPYMKQAYEAKKWGFVPDYARIDIVLTHGGFYFDTDVEILKPLDVLLEDKFFMGFESAQFVNLGSGFGAEANMPMLKKMLEDYDNYSFVDDNGKPILLASPHIQTSFLRKYNLKDDDGSIQILDGNVKIYPVDYFCPKSCVGGKLNITRNSLSIHHFDGSWLPWKQRFIAKLHLFLSRYAPWLLKFRRKLLGR